MRNCFVIWYMYCIFCCNPPHGLAIRKCGTCPIVLHTDNDLLGSVLQDAHNLAWKLAAVLKGTASPTLLASYQAERKPVAQANTDLSVANWHEAVKVPKVLGLDPRAANLLNAAVASGPISLLPSGELIAMVALQPMCCVQNPLPSTSNWRRELHS